MKGNQNIKFETFLVNLEKNAQVVNDYEELYFPGTTVTQGGVLNNRTNRFGINCSESIFLDNWKPKKFVKSHELVVLTAWCGNNCAQFINQQLAPRNAAYFLGAGGFVNQELPTSVGASGFASNIATQRQRAGVGGIPYPQPLIRCFSAMTYAGFYNPLMPKEYSQYSAKKIVDERIHFWQFNDRNEVKKLENGAILRTAARLSHLDEFSTDTTDSEDLKTSSSTDTENSEDLKTSSSLYDSTDKKESVNVMTILLVCIVVSASMTALYMMIKKYGQKMTLKDMLPYLNEGEGSQDHINTRRSEDEEGQD